MDSCLTRFLDSSVKCDSNSDFVDANTVATKSTNNNSKKQLSTLICQVADISTTLKLQSSTNKYYKLIPLMSVDPSMSSKFPIMKRRMDELEKILYPTAPVAPIPGVIETGDLVSNHSPISATPLKNKTKYNLNGNDDNDTVENDEIEISNCDTMSIHRNDFHCDDDQE
jgi:hypothetical protein